jgi:hypothetical protein
MLDSNSESPVGFVQQSRYFPEKKRKLIQESIAFLGSMDGSIFSLQSDPLLRSCCSGTTLIAHQRGQADIT